MSWLDAIVLGLIQGLTEFIPVSSDGHLSAAEMLMPRFAQVGLLFDVMVHVGTLAAIGAFIIGAVQGFAVLPGLSRSASTIGFGLLLGFTGRWAADYTFLLAIPAIVGAAGVEILSALRHEGPGFFATPDFARYLLGAAVAGAVGYMTIGFLIRMVSTRKVHWFALYCFAFGLVLIFLFPS